MWLNKWPLVNQAVVVKALSYKSTDFIQMPESSTLYCKNVFVFCIYTLTSYCCPKVMFSCILFVYQVSSLSDCKRFYVLKKENVPILPENCRNILLFGMLSPSLILQLSASVDKVKEILLLLNATVCE